MNRPSLLTRLILVAAATTTLLSPAAWSQVVAPNSLKGLTITVTVLGGNNAPVAPTSTYSLATSGRAKYAFNASSMSQLNATTDAIEAVGTYTLASSGNVATATTTLTGFPVLASPPALPSAPVIQQFTFTSALAGTFAFTWGNATNSGTFTLEPSSDLVPLVNIATRADLVAGQSLVPGFVVGGPIARKVLIRAIGPTLAAFSVPAPIPSTTLSIYSGSQVIASNTGWSSAGSDAAALRNAFTSVGAFDLPNGSADSAVVLTLAPGAYTAMSGGATAADRGTILVEVYFVP